MASIEDPCFYPICFLADVFNCLTCPWFEWDPGSGRCRNHGARFCKLKPGQAEGETPGPNTIYQ